MKRKREQRQEGKEKRQEGKWGGRDQLVRERGPS